MCFAADFPRSAAARNDKSVWGRADDRNLRQRNSHSLAQTKLPRSARRTRPGCIRADSPVL